MNPLRLAGGVAALALVALNSAGDALYRKALERWRVQHEAELKAEDGWLAVAGLFWLKEGRNTAGSDPSNDIVLPRGPAKAGVFELRAGKTTFRAATGASVPVNEKDQVRFDGLVMTVIQRGDRFGVRLKDPASKQRREFTGLHWFPARESYRVTGKFVAYEKPKMIPITNVLGQTEPEASPGYVTFTLQGRSLRLEPVTEDDRLFFIFRDLTAGWETYPAGRFLYASWPKNGEVELDFNKAENPPCAFTAYATCPLPPKQNRLAIRIEAGELNYGH
ncbi:MAG: DUF1684 domain-containing protein [Acidobacteriia bacterium]|nr:DUF1684 domain-containing protein [Terriglobia bacterium]